MQEVVLEKNPLGVKIMISGQPNIEFASQEKKDMFLATLQVQVAELYKKKRTKSKDSASSSKNG